MKQWKAAPGVDPPKQASRGCLMCVMRTPGFSYSIIATTWTWRTSRRKEAEVGLHDPRRPSCGHLCPAVNPTASSNGEPSVNARAQSPIQASIACDISSCRPQAAAACNQRISCCICQAICCSTGAIGHSPSPTAGPAVPRWVPWRVQAELRAPTSCQRPQGWDTLTG